MEAIDKNAKTDLQKTEDQYMAIMQSLVRPIVRKKVEYDRNARDR